MRFLFGKYWDVGFDYAEHGAKLRSVKGQKYWVIELKELNKLTGFIKKHAETDSRPVAIMTTEHGLLRIDPFHECE